MTYSYIIGGQAAKLRDNYNYLYYLNYDNKFDLKGEASPSAGFYKKRFLLLTQVVKLNPLNYLQALQISWTSEVIGPQMGPIGIQRKMLQSAISSQQFSLTLKNTQHDFHSSTLILQCEINHQQKTFTVPLERQFPMRQQ